MKCDYGDFYDYVFPGNGQHHETVYVPQCQNPVIYEYPYHHQTFYRCEEHKIAVVSTK